MKEAQAYGTEQANIDNYVTQETYAFITGGTSIASGWSGYLSGLKNLGLASYVSTTNTVADKDLLYGDTADYSATPAEIKYLLQEGRYRRCNKSTWNKRAFRRRTFRQPSKHHGKAAYPSIPGWSTSPAGHGVSGQADHREHAPAPSGATRGVLPFASGQAGEHEGMVSKQGGSAVP